jgi:uncharacterized membrane protein YedE/YeeE
MAMSAPLYKLGSFGPEASLIVAFLLGLGFGFALERGGFGSARKLVSQFYLDDMAVFKVMFTSIVTAGLGAFYLGWIGFLDYSLIYMAPTYLWPQLLGGLLLGFGFVVGGYCPGTSLVAAVTGRFDGMLFVVGVFGGIIAFGTIFPRIEEFFVSGSYGALTLPEVFGVSEGVVMFAVVVIAVAGFVGAEAVERLMAQRAERS